MTDAKGPLNGIRVIDLGRHQAGPRCAQVLAGVRPVDPSLLVELGGDRVPITAGDAAPEAFDGVHAVVIRRS